MPKIKRIGKNMVAEVCGMVYLSTLHLIGRLNSLALRHGIRSSLGLLNSLQGLLMLIH